jgi:hypothetical protein
MPTNRTKRTRKGAGQLDYWKIDQLVTGEPSIAGTGYGAALKHVGGCNHWAPKDWYTYRAAMQDDWRLIGSQFMAWWRGETEQFSAIYASVGGKRRDPGVTPWALREFGEPAQ